MYASVKTRRDFLKVISLGAASLAVPGCAGISGQRTGKASKDKLNFVFILIDDMGWMDAGCYGSTFYETPNIDRLAAEGMRFTDAYAACPVCSPTRASILTGKYPARLNLTNWLSGKIRKKLIGAPYIGNLPLEEVTIAEALKEAGYATCCIGKWHLCTNPEFIPVEQGFDASVDRQNLRRSHKLKKTDPKVISALTDESLKFLEANRNKPFFLYLSHYAVHTPLEAKKQLVAKYKDKAAGLPPAKGPRFLSERQWQVRQVQDHAVYAGMVQSMDESVGHVMKKLKQLGVADNTVVIFMSDNGGLSTAEGHPTSNIPLRAGKGWLYEGGIREPMIIKWPSLTKGGSVCCDPVTSTDFYPTMLQMAGLPLRTKQHHDGVSLVPLLKGSEALDRKAIYWHYPHYSPQGGTPGGAVRSGNYKLIEFYEDNHIELYNLKKDISEKHNLSAEMPEKVAELRKMLHNWRKSVDAQMPIPNPQYKSKTGE